MQCPIIKYRLSDHFRYTPTFAQDEKNIALKYVTICLTVLFIMNV